MGKADGDIEVLIDKIFENYLSAEMGYVYEFSTNIKFDTAQVTAKVKKEKADLANLLADRGRLDRVDELQALNRDIFGDLVTTKEIKNAISKRIGRLAEPQSGGEDAWNVYASYTILSTRLLAR